MNFSYFQQIYRNLSATQLVEKALARGEGILASTGALVVTTGKYTGRSAKDKFVVDLPSIRDQINWGPVNQPMSEENFKSLYGRLLAYLQNKEVFIFDGFVGADPAFRMPIRVINELAWQNLFSRQLFLRPAPEELAGHEPAFTVVSAPGFRADPDLDGTRSEAFIVLHLEANLIIIGGTSYAGEIKKSIFTALNFLLPRRGIFPMHCSANLGATGDLALFFGLSGTGKTSLSADPQRRLIGDDEHGWSENGIFNFEGGCYAKCISLSAENEPQIWSAIRFGTVLENVVVDPATRQADYDSAALTENTRAAYPVDFIPEAVIPGVGGHPRAILFLTADAFGVLPPIAKLTREQAMYHFLSGYTSKLAGTERGITEPQATFSTCFGAPFLPLYPFVYMKMLGEKIARYNPHVYLINTGWSGGPYGVGRRIDIKFTRAMVTAALEGRLEEVELQPDPVFMVLVPARCPGVPEEILNPRNTWADAAAYEETARKLAGLFAKNFRRFYGVDREIASGGPVF